MSTLVINVGAPKGASRLTQRIGRANHRLDEPSRALLVPSNRFEVLECRAALDAALAGDQDVVLNRSGALDVAAQHILGVAVSGPFDPDILYREIRSALPYTTLQRAEYKRLLDFVSTGGYALRAYERYAKLRPTADGRLRLSHTPLRPAISGQCRHHHRQSDAQRPAHQTNQPTPQPNHQPAPSHDTAAAPSAP